TSGNTPLKLIIKGSQTIEINHIVIGDVFILGGQSNMEWPISMTNDADKEILNADYPNIRLFTVPRNIKSEATLQMDAGGWQAANSESVKDFSAIGFLLGRQIHLEKGVPVGLIDNSWGGTNIMGWMPEEAFANMPKYENLFQEFKSNHRNDQSVDEMRESWITGLEKNDKGIQQNWSEAAYAKTNWQHISVPGLWEEQGFANKDGVFWYAKDIILDANTESDCILSLGQIDDSDIVYLNGYVIGRTENAYNVYRKYKA
ncbi:MAG TPA: sialate O-acetylesterase, partial [Saprospiraceae bacterium]|nr:sialate O-acetylesterase [Saprospiraceae bacterium]